MTNFFEDLFSEETQEDSVVDAEFVEDNIVVLPELNITDSMVKETLGEIKAVLIEKYYGKIEQLETLANNHLIKDEATEVQAVDMVSQLKEMRNTLETKRKDIIKVPGSYVNGVNAIVKPFRDKIDTICKIKNKDLLEYQRKVREERKKQEKKAAEVIEKVKKDTEEEAKRAGIDPGVFDIQVPSLSKDKVTVGQTGGTATIKEEWVYEVVDIKEVPVELIEVIDKEVKKLIKAGTRNIPGLNIYLDDKLKTRKARKKKP